MQVDTVQAVGSEELHEHARLGSTVVGGLLGAAIGVVMHLVLETGLAGTRPYEAIWFALAIGGLTGLGVRMANKGHMTRSYTRGAVSGVVALLAILASTFLIAQVMSRREALNKAKPIAAAQAAAANAEANGAAADAAAEPAAAPLQDPAAQAGVAGMIGRPGADKLNPWQFVFMAAGALVAYELGRGVEPRHPAQRFAVEPVTVTNPSN